MRRLSVFPVAAVFALVAAANVSATTDTSTLVTNGSPPTAFAHNKQNEPAITHDANHPNVVVAGANDEIDDEDCNVGDPTRCPFTGGVGTSGVYFSFDSGHTWHQPTYTGWSARQCNNPAAVTGYSCSAAIGPIGTLPLYFENGLVSDGDPGVAIGPQPGAGGFNWSNGSRLYYSNLTSNFSSVRSETAFNGMEAIAVSRTDNIALAAAGGDAGKAAWMPPVLVSQQSSTTFSDKSQIWADNASSSSFFGNVYVCWGDFVGQEKGHAAPAQLKVGVSRDGGNTWAINPIGAAANNSQRNPLDGCTIRTDSHGNAFVFGIGTVSALGKDHFELMSQSTDGGASWSSPIPVVGPVFQPGAFDPVLGRPVIDGVAGARSDLAPGPSVDIANGAPTGAGATNRIVMSFVSGTLAAPHVFFTESTNGGGNWSTPRSIEPAGDRGYYTAPAISPDGTHVYVVYNAFTTPFRTDTSSPRNLIGVVMQASASGTAPTGAFNTIDRTLGGDPRGSSQNNLVGEFLGDYVYATASNVYGAAVWNDTRGAADCPAIDAWRMSLRNGTSVPRPAPERDCPPQPLSTFGNSDIFGFTSAP